MFKDTSAGWTAVGGGSAEVSQLMDGLRVGSNCEHPPEKSYTPCKFNCFQ